eukprot:scaffold268_cov236-Pinguiococcus_pyrenoidosus.AAC.25
MACSAPGFCGETAWDGRLAELLSLGGSADPDLLRSRLDRTATHFETDQPIRQKPKAQIKENKAKLGLFFMLPVLKRIHPFLSSPPVVRPFARFGLSGAGVARADVCVGKRSPRRWRGKVSSGMRLAFRVIWLVAGLGTPSAMRPVRLPVLQCRAGPRPLSVALQDDLTRSRGERAELQCGRPVEALEDRGHGSRRPAQQAVRRGLGTTRSHGVLRSAARGDRWHCRGVVAAARDHGRSAHRGAHALQGGRPLSLHQQCVRCAGDAPAGDREHADLALRDVRSKHVRDGRRRWTRSEGRGDMQPRGSSSCREPQRARAAAVPTGRLRAADGLSKQVLCVGL